MLMSEITEEQMDYICEFLNKEDLMMDLYVRKKAKQNLIEMCPIKRWSATKIGEERSFVKVEISLKYIDMEVLIEECPFFLEKFLEKFSNQELSGFLTF